MRCLPRRPAKELTRAETPDQASGCAPPNTEEVAQGDAAAGAGTGIPLPSSVSVPERSPPEITETGQMGLHIGRVKCFPESPRGKIY